MAINQLINGGGAQPCIIITIVCMVGLHPQLVDYYLSTV